MLKLKSAIRRHGGKHYLADKIVGLMPPRCSNSNAPASNDFGWTHYVEPYFGGGSVLFANDPEGISEVVNDSDKNLSCFWNVLRSDFDGFVREVQATPCSASEFENSHYELAHRSEHTPLQRAVHFFICNRQSRQGLEKDFATLVRNRTRRGMNELASAWLSALDGLPAVHKRLKRVVILNDKATKVIEQQDGPRTLFYLDPPYVHETRTAKEAYKHEMTLEQHAELLQLLTRLNGRFLLSGYRCELYDRTATENNWRRVDFQIDNKASSKKSKDKKVESVWLNY